MDKNNLIEMNSSMFFMENLNRCNESLEEQCILLRTIHYSEGLTELCVFPLPCPSAFLTFNTLRHWYSYSPHCSLYIPYDTDKENLFDDQELLKLVIISFILVTSTFDS